MSISSDILFLIWHKIQPISRNNLGASGSNFAKLCHVMCREAGVIIGVQIWESKKRPNFCVISDNFKLRS